MPINNRITELRDKLGAYGKENQGELLYALSEGARLLSGSERVRIYLEDLTSGVLSCVHATGEHAGELRQHSFPIISTETIVSSVFVSQYPADFRVIAAAADSPDLPFAQRFGFRS